MLIKRLQLINFRNYNKLDIEFNENKNIFYGYNAQGKTNILEALYFTACSRSHRTKKDKELIMWGKQECLIRTWIKKGFLDVEIDIKINKDFKKEIKINNNPVKRVGELMGILNVVMFSPEDLKLIKEGPAERRRFIDITNSQLKPSYFYNLQKYFKIIRQRNTLLRNIKNNKKLLDTLSVWNNNLVETGSKIMYYRNEYFKKMSFFVKDIHKKIANEEISIKYIPSVNVEDLSNMESIKKYLLSEIDKNIEKDIHTETTSIGPHRDNFEIFIDNVNIKTYGSQGQQRTAILSLKLAEVKLFKEEIGEYPVLLLDDVMSELDEKRQKFILDYLQDMQIFLTCTNNKEDYKRENSSFYKVVNGFVTKE